MIFRINPTPIFQGWERRHDYSDSHKYRHDMDSTYGICNEVDILEIFSDALTMESIEQTGKANYLEWNW